MKTRLIGVVAVAMVVLLPAAAIAQDQRDLPIETVNVAAYPEVSVTVAAPRDLIGTDLQAADFELTENGLQVAFDLSRLPNEGLQVVLALDTSGSMRGTALEQAKSAALGFIGQMPPTTSVAVLGFGSEAVLVSPFTTDLAAAAGAVSGLTARGETALYDAVSVALDQFPPAADVRRVLVLLSDGGDTLSTSSLEQATARLATAGVSFYAVELPSAEADHAALESMATAAGGRLVAAGDATALAGIYEQLASAIVNQYRLTYTSAATGSTGIRVALDAAGISAAGAVIAEFPAGVLPTVPTTAPTTTPTTVAVVPPTTVPQIVDRAAPEIVQAPGILGTQWGLRLGIGLLFAALLVLSAILLAPKPAEVRLAGPRRSTTGKALAGLAEQASYRAQQFLEQRGQAGGLNHLLDRAGVLLRPGEFLVLAGSIAVTAGAVGFLALGPVGALAFLVIAVLGTRVFLILRAERRTAAFGDQLEDNLQLLAGSLRAGYGLLQAIDTVAQQAPSPSREEFSRVMMETRLGRDLDESLRTMAERLGNQDFEWVVEAIAIQHEVGGDLAEVLDTVAGTIRDRNWIKNQIKSLSAEGRISAIILIGLPFFLAFAMAIINPGYFQDLVGTTPGRIMLIAAAALLVAGSIWIRRIIRLVF